MKEKVFIQTFGCQMNVYDSERLKAILINNGCELTDQPKDASVIILNTCCVRETAENRAWGRLTQLYDFKMKNPEVRLILAGCMAQEMGKEALEKAPYLDLVLGTSQFFNLLNFLKSKDELPKIAIDEEEVIFDDLLPVRKNRYTSFVAISRGCDNFCSYCIVPYVRGREIHRKKEEILKEVQCLTETGSLEVSLIGQNVNSYQDNRFDFPDLLNLVNDKTGIQRIRFMTSHPKDLSDKLIDKMASLPKVCEHLHLPLQSGSTKILKKMNRGYLAEDYLRLVEKAKDRIPHLSLTTDLIVGFPGERAADFEETLKMVQKIEFDSSFMFRYSPRERTKAGLFEDDVPLDEKLRRLKVLIELQKEISKKKNQKLIGQVEEVLVDDRSKRDRNLWKGKSRTNKTVIVNSDKNLLGSIVKVRISEVDSWTLFGKLIDSS
ncbi:MAG: tRNA (N6-isopentenyl adenosine(37)-C2)-methylthiotransferase MiaB [Candidatus Zixiibacteriota bacterium]